MRSKSHTLEDVFDSRACTDYNASLLYNASVIVDIHEESRGEFNEKDLDWAMTDRDTMSHTPKVNQRSIDRKPKELMSYHDISVQQLTDFADGGTVVDVGAGRSGLLDAVVLDAKTIAVDIHEEHVAYQAAKGHRAIHAPASDLGEIESDSVDVLHAAYSAPFWCISFEDAEQTAEEYVRVLRPGGLALVGALANQQQHLYYENYLIRKSHKLDAVMQYTTYHKFGSHVRTSFVAKILDEQIRGAVDVVGTRHVGRTGYHMKCFDTHVPNFMMIYKN
jgi:ubiquinone/menaquinone biosynthesis C-methylase UbiE